MLISTRKLISESVWQKSSSLVRIWSNVGLVDKKIRSLGNFKREHGVSGRGLKIFHLNFELRWEIGKASGKLRNKRDNTHSPPLPGRVLDVTHLTCGLLVFFSLVIHSCGLSFIRCTNLRLTSRLADTRSTQVLRRRSCHRVSELKFISVGDDRLSSRPL